MLVQPTSAPGISFVSVRSPGVEVIRRTEADDPGLPGVLWQTRLLPIKVSLDTMVRSLETDAFYDGVEYAWRMNVDILNMSNGFEYEDDPVTGQTAVEQADDWTTTFEAHHGTDVLIAAGTPNADRDLDEERFYALPAEAGYANIVHATAIGLDGNPTPFTVYSSSRTSVDIAGPTPSYTLYNTILPDNQILVLTGEIGNDFLGSSAVAPQISGILGLMLARNPVLQTEAPQTIIELLLHNGASVSGKLANGLSCRCRLDAHRAVTAAAAYQP